MNSERKIAFTDKPFESRNKAKSKFTEEEYNKRRRTNAFINCGEVGHKFSECPKPKPGCFENVVGTTVPTTRAYIS